MSQVQITIEFRDPLKPSKTTKPMHPETALAAMRDAVMSLAFGEYAAIYITKCDALHLTPPKES